MTSSPPLVDHPTRGSLIRWAKLYDKAVGVISLGREETMRQGILTRAALRPGERVLDVGCGTGTLAIRAAGEGSEVIGIDPAAKMVERSRMKAAEAGSSARFQVGVAENLAFEDESFDVVLCTLVLHHLPPGMQDDCLKEMARVLRRQGRLILVDFSGPGPLLHRVGGLFRSHEHTHGTQDHLAERLLRLGFAGADRTPLEPSYLFCLVAHKSGS